MEIHSFGTVLYDNRIIIVFGVYGVVRQMKIYYLDIKDDKGWIESELELKTASSHNALMMDEDTVDILPFYDSQLHLIVKVEDILPASLLR